MSNFAQAETYFIAGMMVLILIICVSATFIFFRQYRRERGRKHEAGNRENSDTGN